MGELLLELLSEEIPARMQRRAIEDLSSLVRDKLAAAEIPATDWRFYVTPRRLAMVAQGIPATQPDRSEERRGPRLGAPQPAIEGFLRSAGLASIEECEIRDTGRGEFYFAVVRRSGRPSAEVLPELIKAAIVELPWPKSMRWPGSSLRWVRPLTSVVCLYDGEVLPLALDSLPPAGTGGVPVGRTTRGHRFMSPGEICVADAAEYAQKLDQAYVILDQDRRKDMIRSDLDRRAAELGIAVKPDPGLLDEVTGLAEFPVVLAGSIDPDFVQPLPKGLPPEVLQTTMRVHQKYFSCVCPDGRPAPHFLFVANNLAEDGGKAIVAGNERVLRARLADARFFWDQDRRIRLEDQVEALKGRVYHAKLGSMYDKVERMDRLAVFLAQQLYPAPLAVAPAQAGARGDRPAPALGSRFRGNDGEELMRSAQRAAHLAKADLSTGMVGEFPELQGIMGRYYALHDGEADAVADAIADHYKPLGPSDHCPTKPVSVVTALADKIDTLVAFFAIGEKPTGSRDPFALRRAALGVIRLVLENGLRLPIFDAILPIAQFFVGAVEARSVAHELFNFVLDRLNTHLRANGFDYDIIAAALYAGDLPADPPARTKKGMEQDFTRLVQRADAVRRFLSSDDGSSLLTAFRRASNIVAIEEERDRRTYDGPVDWGVLQMAEEAALYQRLSALAVMLGSLLVEERFDRAMSRLATLRRPVDEFFEQVTVNTDVPALRENRLRLLSAIRATMNRVADFSQIEG